VNPLYFCESRNSKKGLSLDLASFMHAKVGSARGSSTIAINKLRKESVTILVGT
jgi:hypothetical protein